MSLVKFNESNIKTRFIKNLLEHSYVPNVNTISNFESNIENLLPKEYQQVEWIESQRESQSAGAYIDTGVVGNQNSGFDIKFVKLNNISSSTTYGCIFGGRRDSSSNELQLTTYKGNTTYNGTLGFRNSRYDAGLVSDDTTIQTVSLRNRKYVSHNKFIDLPNNSFSTPVTITLFALNDRGAIKQYGNVRLYYFKMYDGNTLIRNFIPCYHKFYKTRGLYDTVFQKFYANQGIGTFLKGADVGITKETNDNLNRIQLNVDYFYKDSIINIDSYKVERPAIFPDDYNISTISKINYDINTYIPQYTRYFKNRYNYYDSETHAYLGDYLRTLRDVYNLDLMSLYNVFNEQYITDIELKLDDNYKVVFNEQDTDTYKVYAVPIKYNKSYTIALQCASNVLISPILYDHRALVKNIPETQEDKYYTEFLKYDSSINVGGMAFNKPYVFQGVSSEMSDEGVSIFEDANFLYNQERNLYLLIQVPKNNKSSLVVIEGEYNFGSCRKVISLGDIKEETDLSDYYVNTTYTSKPDLLSVNDGNNYAFSDRLIEYLTLNTIDNNDKIEFNVLDVQRKLSLPETTIWNDEMRINLYNRLLSLDEDKRRQINIDNKDILGYVDKDIERYLNSVLFNLNFDDLTKTDEEES